MSKQKPNPTIFVDLSGINASFYPIYVIYIIKIDKFTFKQNIEYIFQ